MNIPSFVTSRLRAFRDHTGMWGSCEAVELQAIQLLEVEARTLLEGRLDDEPRLVLNMYVETIREHHHNSDTRPLHELVGSDESQFGPALYQICESVRERIRGMIPHRPAQRSSQVIADDELHSEIGIDGSWNLDDLSDFPKVYSSVYYFLYLAQNQFATDEPERRSHIFASYKWKGGYVYGTFFREIAKLIPPTHCPTIEAIKYASPGFIRLRLNRSTAESIGMAIDHFLEQQDELATYFKDAWEWNRRCNKLLDADRKPTPEDMQSLHHTTALFTAKLGAVNFDLLLKNTAGDVLIASNIVLAYYRRLEELAHYRAEEKARFL